MKTVNRVTMFWSPLVQEFLKLLQIVIVSHTESSCLILGLRDTYNVNNCQQIHVQITYYAIGSKYFV